MRGFGGQKNVRGRSSVGECHEKTVLVPKNRAFLDDPSCTVEGKEY